MPPDLHWLSPAHVPAAFALSKHVGWNQSEADWRRLLEMDGNSAVGMSLAGELVATATVMRYGTELAWIGMVIVHQSQRGRGLGKAVLSTAVQLAQQRSGAAVGLDATELGRPLYEKAGFAEVQPIVRWAGSVHETPRDDPDVVSVVDTSMLAALTAFDRQASGVDRSALLSRLLGEEGNAAWIARNAGQTSGYAVLRPGREYWQLGPLVSSGRRETMALLNATARKLDGAPVLMDLLDQAETAALLEGTGLKVQRRLLRMSLGGRKPTLSGGLVRLAAGLELG